MKIFNHAGKKNELIYSNRMKMLLQTFCCQPWGYKTDDNLFFFSSLVFSGALRNCNSSPSPLLWHYYISAKSRAYFSFSLRTFCPKKDQIIMITVDWDQNIIIEHWEPSLLYTTPNKQVVLHFNYYYSCLWINFCAQWLSIPCYYVLIVCLVPNVPNKSVHMFI